MQFIELEALCAPRVRQRFERHVRADLVSESEAVSNRASEAVDANGLTLDAVLLDAKIEYGRGDVHYSKRRRRHTWHTRARVLNALQTKLLRKEIFEEFCHEYAKQMNRLRMERRAGQSSAKRELERVRRDIQKVIEAIKAGYAGPELKAEMGALQMRKEALLSQLKSVNEPPTLLHPSVADLYRTKVEQLAAALQREDTRLEASEMLRGFIDSIVLTPEKGQLRIELRGNLAAMLTVAQKTTRSPESGDLIVPVQLVAGACNQPYLQLWNVAS
jgi:hypothetical protein